MAEEVKERTFSEMQAGDGHVVPENLYVIKRAKVNYEQFWSEKTNKFGPLLDATFYTETPSNVVSNGEVVDYRQVIGLK